MENKRPFMLLPCDHGMCTDCHATWIERAKSGEDDEPPPVPHQVTPATLERIATAVHNYEAVVHSSARSRVPRRHTGSWVEGDNGAGARVNPSPTATDQETATSSDAMARATSGSPNSERERGANRRLQERRVTLSMTNDEGVRVALGQGPCSHRYYCGRELGKEELPGSDGRCGPNNGPQCPSCHRFQVGQLGRVAHREHIAEATRYPRWFTQRRSGDVSATTGSAVGTARDTPSARSEGSHTLVMSIDEHPEGANDEGAPAMEPRSLSETALAADSAARDPPTSSEGVNVDEAVPDMEPRSLSEAALAAQPTAADAT
eukprot:CAMPEP_0178382990 /NCGR_PEP_ID=MMETSP0689_2-20121128/6774_1 /TAXON_ID=160604 /ORGANISM="Amphidinium massartii, Strain CS-259" /LENGTH=318 /DNA_ID=CAMNT_0020003203 /DNA_START=89 /DNA_END=1045 /DNA_ORIENTATION=-